MIGAVMVWSVAAGMVAAVPCGLGWAAWGVLASRYSFPGGAAERVFHVMMGLGLAASAAALVAQWGPAFRVVML